MKSSSAACWTWYISATGYSTLPGAATASECMTRWKAFCLLHDMPDLVDVVRGIAVPSRAFNEGGIHEAIMAYEDTVFYEILAEELARRDMELEGIAAETPEGMVDLNRRIGAYLDEFEAHGTDNLTVEGVE